ncbi:hypothetical protein ACFV98_30575 [Streptomyces violascens]|uniref:hypothetical protein n=1 Tax=Streptomyces violascens TaxID=67381 RepID=UPI003653DCCA
MEAKRSLKQIANSPRKSRPAGRSPTLKNTVAPVAEITMKATHLPALVRGSLRRYRSQLIANQWMPYVENASAAMYSGGALANTWNRVSPTNRISPVTSWQKSGLSASAAATPPTGSLLTRPGKSCWPLSIRPRPVRRQVGWRLATR